MGIGIIMTFELAKTPAYQRVTKKSTIKMIKITSSPDQLFKFIEYNLRKGKNIIFSTTTL